MKLPILPAPFNLLTRRSLALLLSAILVGFFGTTRLLEAARAAGFDAGGRTTNAGSLADCSDSGILVALSAAQQKELGKCPLKHTDVRANVSGYVARVSVRQQFHNPFKEKIEAVYTFPLPADAAVDEMTMKVGNRVIKGSIKKREEARQIYDAARARGNVASLLDQERPNIFTQSVANIEPGENIDIEIKYVNLLKYEDGAFTFTFPTVVGPRFIPGHASLGTTGTGQSPDTDLVRDASKITPAYAPEGQRAGHDIGIDLNITAGVPIQSINSKLHEVDIEHTQPAFAHVRLKDKDKIPNKDFIVSWNVAADSVRSGYLTHRQGQDGFFTLMLIPPKRVEAKHVQPKEMIFIIDCSGSQRGRPIQKARETMEYILEHMNPNDTFQIIAFNNDVEVYPEHPQTASASMKQQAVNFIHNLDAHGGTWMAPAVEAACAVPNEEHRLRIMTFMTDGCVGNDFQIIGMIKKFRDKTRWFSFGTGNSVNHFLIDNIAKEGGGEADYVLLNSSAQEVGKKFYDRISSPVLTDLQIAFEGVATKEVFPRDLADLWAQRPLYFTGRYLQPGSGKVILTGYSGGKPYRQEMALQFPEKQEANDVLPSIWARAKVERLMSENLMSVQNGSLNQELKDEIVQTALKYHIMSQYTSFVAVEEDRKTSGDKAKLVPVPVETPQGVQMELGRGGPARWKFAPNIYSANQRMTSMPGSGGSGTGASYGSPGSFSLGGSTSGYLSTAGLVPPPPAARGFGSMSAGGLPSTNMGKFVHQPGDNQYSPLMASKAEPMMRDSRRAQASNLIYGDASTLPVGAEHETMSKSKSQVDGRVKSEEKNNEKGSEAKKPAESKAASEKLDSRLRVVLQDLSGGKKNASVIDGKVRVRIELSVRPDEVLLQKLKKLGFEIDRSNGKLITGKIAAAAVEELAKLDEVVRIKLS